MRWLSKLLNVTSGILLSENRALYLDCIESSIHVSRIFWLTKLFNLWLQVFMRRGLPIIPGEVPKDIALLQFLIIRLCFPVIKVGLLLYGFYFLHLVLKFLIFEGCSWYRISGTRAFHLKMSLNLIVFFRRKKEKNSVILIGLDFEL